jgi:hypothetical protein
LFVVEKLPIHFVNPDHTPNPAILNKSIKSFPARNNWAYAGDGYIFLTKKSKTMKLTFFKKTALLALACTAVVLLSWTKGSQSTVKDLSEEEVFEGLVFMKGKLVGMVPELQEAAIIQAKMTASSNGEQGLNKLQSEILRRIKAKHPGYLSQFKQVLMSGNQYAIRAELQKADQYTASTMGDVLGMDFTDLASKREAVANLLGNKLTQMKELYRRFQIGEIGDMEFKAANDALLADKKEALVAIFSNPTSFNTHQVAASGAGACIAVNLAFALNITTYVNIAVLTNLYAHTNIYIGVNYWSGGGGSGGGIFHFDIMNSLNGERMINSIANRLKQ